MTTYRDPNIRPIVLRCLGEVTGEQSDRYAQVVGILTALLEDDKELREAIHAACHGSRTKEAPCSAA